MHPAGVSLLLHCDSKTRKTAPPPLYQHLLILVKIQLYLLYLLSLLKLSEVKTSYLFSWQPSPGFQAELFLLITETNPKTSFLHILVIDWFSFSLCINKSYHHIESLLNNFKWGPSFSTSHWMMMSLAFYLQLFLSTKNMAFLDHIVFQHFSVKKLVFQYCM